MLELHDINLFILYSFLVTKLVKVLTFMLLEHAAQLRHGEKPVNLPGLSGWMGFLSACTRVSQTLLALEKEKIGRVFFHNSTNLTP